uniref:Uncharacterized protein n=1 Tax=Anopheles dirus TaxID=7168 RepID=A0A182NYA6_9DIPT
MKEMNQNKKVKSCSSYCWRERKRLRLQSDG